MIDTPRARLVPALGWFPSRRDLKLGGIVGSSVAVEFGSQFLRTVLLARMLDPTEFGLVASINAFVSILEMSTSFGPGRYLVYAADGAEPQSVAAVHGVTLVRGVLLAALLVLLAWPTASLLRQPEHAWSFAAVALVPFLRGLTHFGVVQMQRAERFGAFSVSEASAAVAGLVGSVAAARLLGDHRAILWGLAAQMVWLVVATHVLAPGSYRASFDLARIRPIMRFGLPLMVNAAALAVASQLNRLVVGGCLGVPALGTFGLTMTLLLQPVALLMKLGTVVLQPRISAAWHADRSRYERFARRSAAATGIGGFVVAVTAVCLALPVFELVFGAKFAVSESMFVVLAFSTILRLGGGILSIFGVATGRTADLMYSNLAGCVGLLATTAALIFHPTITAALLGVLVADLCSFVIVALRLHDVGWPTLRAICLAAAGPALLAAWILVQTPSAPYRMLAVAAALCAGALLLKRLVWTEPHPAR